MKKILFISGPINMAGTETFMLNIVRSSDRDKFHYDFLVSGNATNNAYTRELESLGCKFYYTVSRRDSFFKYHKQLDAFFKEHQGEYDAVHWCGGNVSSLAPLRYAYKYKVPIRIVHSHNSSCEGFHNKILHSINKCFLSKICTHFFACSSLAANFFFNKKSAVIIKNGINVDAYKYCEFKREKVRAEFGIRNDEFVVGHVGRFTIVKNHKFIIDVFKQFLQIEPKARLMLVGIGELMDETKILVKDYDLENQVLFLGQRNDVNCLMQAMDVFIMPSLFEGLPFVLVEAQASSLPCVIADTINKDAKISPLVTFLALNENTQIWVDKLREIQQDYRRVDNSYLVIDNGFSMKDTIKYLERIYSEEQA